MLKSRSYIVFGATIALLTFFGYMHMYTGGRIIGSDFTPDRTSSPNVPDSNYVPGKPKPNGLPYSKTLVVARLEAEDVSWIDASDAPINKAIYVVDNPSLSPDFQVPKNKGHEAMVYLTYIIDYYDQLSDISIFVHAHKTTWHNNDLLDSDMLKTIAHLSEAHMARQGYFNLRCHHEPGCPDWLHLDRPDSELDNVRKMEEKTFSIHVWKELHPNVDPPPAISQPCCAQFAVSKERIHANPRSEYIRYRDWLLTTKLEDTFSGRVMEYSWQFIFAGVAELCPEMHVCYCDGYGICLGGKQELSDWFDMKTTVTNITTEANKLAAEPGMELKIREMRGKAREIEAQMELIKTAAFERGKDPRLRALEVGRPWKEGDGF